MCLIDYKHFDSKLIIKVDFLSKNDKAKEIQEKFQNFKKLCKELHN